MNDNAHNIGHGFGLRWQPTSWIHSQRRKLLAAAAAGLSSAMVLLAGCGPVKLVAHTNIPPPLVMKVPIGVALFIPTEFAGYVHKEERWSTKWQIELGKAQTDGITRLMNSMFERVVTVDSVNAGTQVPGGVAAILEPSIEEYAFVTPRDAGSPFYAVSIKYRVNVYLPDGKLADSWGFTGYGTSPSQGLSSEAPLHAATASAMRDAGAKLAVEFREQAVMRGLIPGAATADAPAAGETPAAPGETSSGAPGDTTAPAAPPTGETPSTPAAPPEVGSSQPPEQQEKQNEDAATATPQETAPQESPAQESPAQENPAQGNPPQENPPQEDPPEDNEQTGEQAEKNKPPAPVEPEALALAPPVS